MQKNILITGSTDGIGLETAKVLLEQGHRVVLHGRNAKKLESLQAEFSAQFSAQQVQAYACDLSELNQVRSLAERLDQAAGPIDVLINNAGVYKVPSPVAGNGIDIRFVVNTIAPWLLTRLLLPKLAPDARVINLSSAAQAPVNLAALRGDEQISEDFSAYAQSKLALTMWSMEPVKLGLKSEQSMVAVNPGSLLASKMVREGFGTQGNDIGIGVRVLTHLALDPSAMRNGHYFDNDAGHYADPHTQALDAAKRLAVCDVLASLATRGSPDT